MGLFDVRGSWVQRELPEDAGAIFETSIGHVVSLGGEYVAETYDREDAEGLLIQAMDRAGFWPDCFFVNERGNVDQLVPRLDCSLMHRRDPETGAPAGASTCPHCGRRWSSHPTELVG